MPALMPKVINNPALNRTYSGAFNAGTIIIMNAKVDDVVMMKSKMLRPVKIG